SGPSVDGSAGKRAPTGWRSTRRSSRDEGRSGTMGGSNQLTVTTPSDRELVLTRVVDAPRDLVFEAHSSCEHMSHWWGPRRYEITSCDIDFRPGGSWRIVQAGEDGQEFGFRGEFREIVRPELITWTFEFEPMPGHVSVQTVTFE